MSWHDLYKQHYWPLVRGIHQSLVDSPHIRPVMLTFVASFLTSASCWTNSWVAKTQSGRSLYIFTTVMLQTEWSRWWSLVHCLPIELRQSMEPTLNFHEILIKIFCHENTFENVVCKMAAILFKPLCGKYLQGVQPVSLNFPWTVFWFALTTKHISPVLLQPQLEFCE